MSLAGALNNRQGIIEGSDILTLNVASLDNQFGQLRALGSSGASRFQIGGLFDNRNGTLESANTDLHLAAGNFMNSAGTVLHVGTGSFDIATANVLNAGGSFVTRGGLTLNADSWVNSSIIQAGCLTLNVNHFAQTRSGQLLAAGSLHATGINWTNDGLIASDGDLYLGLSGVYGGTGRLTSRGDLNLQAGQLTLADSASIAAGGDGLINVAGLLSNQGRVTSGGDLTVYAGNLNNYGTLGSGQDLTVTTNALLNDHGLIFSGWDMSLRVASLNNNYGSIYSLGDLNIDRDGSGSWATSIFNSSGLIQSDGAMSLAASTIQNIRALLTVSNGGIYTAKITEIPCIEGVNAGDCSGKRNRVWEIVQRDKLEVTAASVASSITAGGNLNISGGDLLNYSSTIATSGNFTATLNNLTNIGVQTSDTETVRVFRTERASNGSGWSNAANDFTNQYWFESGAYDPNNLGGLTADMSRFIGTTEAELPEFGRVTQLATGDQTYAAVIQAAGNVSITTQNNFDSSVVRGGFDYVGSGPRTDTEAPGSDFSTRIKLNPQLPPDLAQQQVNPLTLPGFELPVGQNGLFRLSGQGGSAVDDGSQGWSLVGSGVGTIGKVQGLPSSSGQPGSHKYLIETNPALTDLKQFMGSDYLLGKLGYNPDESAKRLGDGFYEQKLIQQAVVARTGQRFLDGLASDEAMFRYLMDNAIASKDALHLSLGVSLTAQQVAALTHDIVWLETVVVNGENVLVPVLYLAHSNNRLAANGALIQGQDVSLIAGNDLKSAGTLKATGNLAAMAGNNLVNSGLVNAGNRLNLLAGNDLGNKAGGIISGRDVSLTSLTGDVINERTVTGYTSGNRYNNQHRDFIDSAARIEAGNNLAISAGRDVNNIGGVLHSGGDTRISAGRDVSIGSAEQVNSNEHGSTHRDLTVAQNGSKLDVGRDLSISAGRDLSVIASQIDAGRDIALDAGNNLTLASAANEEHSYSKTKKVEAQEDHVRQIGSNVNASGSVRLSAGQDLTLISSKINAGEEVYLVAGGDLSLSAAQDSDYSLYDKEKKGGWGSKETRRDEVTDIKHVGSEIKTGGDLTLVSGGDQLYQGAKLESGNDLTLDSGGSITFEAVKDLHRESHEKSKGDLAWQSASGKGSTDETLHQSEIAAQGQLTINAVDGLKIDLKQIDQKSVIQAIDAMVQADPNLAWLKEAEQRGDVDWRLVREMHDSWDYESSGLGAAPSLIIAIVASVYLGPLYGAMASNFAVGTINGDGDLGAGFQAATSSAALKGYATQMSTAYVLGYMDSYVDGWKTDGGMILNGNGVNNPGYSSSMLDWNTVAENVLRSGAHALVAGSISTAINGGSWKDNLGNAAISEGFDLTAAFGNKQIGDLADYLNVDPGSASKILMHAMLGGALSAAKGGDFTTGALAGVAAEGLTQATSDALGHYLDARFAADDQFKIATAQIVGILAGASVGGDPATASWVAGNAERYNRQLHTEEKVLARKLAKESDGKYSVKDIEDQLRLSYKKGTDITPATDMVVSGEGIYDSGGNWIPLGGGKLVQNFSAAEKEVIAYIKQNTDAYNWTFEAETGFSFLPQPDWSLYAQSGTGERDRLTGYPLDKNGGYRVPVAVDGVFYSPRFLPCGSAECIAVGANIDFGDVNTLRWIKAANAKMISDVGSAMSAGSIITAGGAAGVLVNGSMAASLLSGYLKDESSKAISSTLLSSGFERFVVLKGMSKSEASKISNALGVAGAWDALINYSGEIIKEN